MIYIIKNQDNQFVLELNGIQDVGTPFYLFEFVHLETNSTIYYTTDNVSGYVCRFDLFELTDNDDTGATPVSNAAIYAAGTDLNMKNGQHRYNIYVYPTDFDVLDPLQVDTVVATGVLSAGRLVVQGVDENIDPIYL